MTDELIDKKVVNALIKEADINPAFNRPGLGITIHLFRFLYGGLWVGGDVFLYRDRLLFCPNAMNLNVHKAGSIGTVVVPISSLTTVAAKFGMVTGIVEVISGTERLVFRCYGAKGFAQKIRQVSREMYSS
jgi:hypothetical protein